ncbi:hypothetical protein EV580_6265 [Mycobacterium sp. BK086]|uniref:hypothetical protein n=1 Tax=Mycobacterium sp. BK086 TaxID=2512165 RepID=UPI00105D098C|nr:MULTISPECIES: hypothetical protein [Mycobacteriaceae]TDO07296.1 hypothetical protein EV580_6265 [Mycobacterium sp. BK086]
MCRAVRCRVCGKTTWSGCGMHIDAVRRGVPADQWCAGHSSGETASRARRTWFGKLKGARRDS